MSTLSPNQSPTWPGLAWLSVALAGAVAPATAIILLADALDPAMLATASGPILSVALMGAGMIAAAAVGRLWVGIALAILAGLGLIGLALIVGMPSLSHPLSALFAFVVASLSFAARGTLFAISAGSRGWWIAIFVVAGEAAIILSAWVEPGLWPDWLLALLPAQWANMAIQTALTGTGTLAASAPLIALGGTAAATLLVARLWPRRWPYAIMFTTWIALSALVYHQPGIGPTEGMPVAADFR
jgi:hypothetical protein